MHFYWPGSFLNDPLFSIIYHWLSPREPYQEVEIWPVGMHSFKPLLNTLPSQKSSQRTLWTILNNLTMYGINPTYNGISSQLGSRQQRMRKFQFGVVWATDTNGGPMLTALSRHWVSMAKWSISTLQGAWWSRSTAHGLRRRAMCEVQLVPNFWIPLLKRLTKSEYYRRYHNCDLISKYLINNHFGCSWSGNSFQGTLMLMMVFPVLYNRLN